MEERRITKVWEDYQNGKSYAQNLGITSQIPINVNFYEGRQWSPPTERTKNMPRPVVNFIEMVVENKISNVLGSAVKLNFIAEGDDEATDRVTNFAEFIQKELNQGELDDIAAQDGAVKGTYIYHYYWDETATGKKGNFEGGLRGEIIDPLNIYFADPREINEQKQKWIIIERREEVSRVREMCDKEEYKKLIVPDNLETAYNEQEQNGSELCTLLTRYFRKNGEVYFEKATKYTMVHGARPLNPLLIEKKLKIKFDEEGNEKIDGQIADSPDSNLEKVDETDIDRFKATLYPIVVGSWKRRDKCIFGRSEVEGLIPNQKAINFQIGMTLMNAQELGCPKIIVKQGSLQGQKITNEPGQVITDYWQGSGSGIFPFQVQPFSAGLMEISPMLLDLTRTVSNSTEVITGDMIGRDLSGTAIAQLQAQADKPIARLRKNFWRAKERIGKVLLQFFVLYYEDKEFSYELTEDKYQNALEEAKRHGLPLESVNRVVSDVFNGVEYRGTRFNIVVEAGAGTQYSEIASMQMLDTLLQMDKITFEQYFELYPKTAMPFKAELRAIQRKNELSENAQLKQLVLNLQEQLKQALVRIKQQDFELKNNQEYTNNLTKEFEKQFNSLRLLVSNQNQNTTTQSKETKSEKQVV